MYVWMYVYVCRGIGWWSSDVVKALDPVLVSSSATKCIFVSESCMSHWHTHTIPSCKWGPTWPHLGIDWRWTHYSWKGDLHDPGWGWTGAGQDHWLCLDPLMRSRLDLGCPRQSGNAGNTPASPCPVPGPWLAQELISFEWFHEP